MNLRHGLRKIAIAALRRFNPGDISIRHHYTGDRIKLHSFMHKGYWYYGKRREKESMGLFAELVRPGDSVVEVGGHIGYITLYFSWLVGERGKVLVFEPGPNNLPYIQSNVRSKSNIELVPRAVSDFSGTASFFIENYTGQNNSLLPDYSRFRDNLRHAGLDVAKSTVEVECVKLDDVLAAENQFSPSFVKIDVEGAELGVLRGMVRTLRERRGLGLMVEVTHKADEVLNLLEGAGFIGFRGRNLPIRTVADVEENTFWLKPEDPRLKLFGMH